MGHVEGATGLCFAFEMLGLLGSSIDFAIYHRNEILEFSQTRKNWLSGLDVTRAAKPYQFFAGC